MTKRDHPNVAPLGADRNTRPDMTDGGPAASPMTSADWIAWRAHLGWSAAEAARQLGISKNMPAAYARGRPIPVYIALACAALAYGLPAWTDQSAPRPLSGERSR